jgi:hypothetical protein
VPARRRPQDHAHPREHRADAQRQLRLIHIVIDQHPRWLQLVQVGDEIVLLSAVQTDPHDVEADRFQ